MKFIPTFITALLGIFLVIPEVDARGSRGGGGHRSGGGHSSAHRGGGGGGARHAPSRSVSHSRSTSHSRPSSSSHTRRAPMTGSHVQRPQSRPAPKPVSRPASKPQARPATRPATQPAKPSIKRPETRPVARPDTRPATLPGRTPGGDATHRPGGGGIQRPENRPDNRPGLDRPGGNKPQTLPGMVTYPNRPDKGRPGQGGNLGIAGGGHRPGGIGRPGGPGDGRPGGVGGIGGIGGAGGLGDRTHIGDNNRNHFGDNNRTHIDNINIGGRNHGLNRPGNLPANKRDWDHNRWGGNNGIWGNRVNIGNDINLNIDRNFINNNNFAFDPGHWGERPWWGAGHYHDWHHGHWNCGWNGGYYHNHWWHDDDDFGDGFMWGMAAWGLGSMVYNMGYYHYSNPYPAPPVQNTYITYQEPLSVATAANPPGDEATVAKAEATSEDALSKSMTAFKAGDYLAASKAIDEALVATPSDVTLHEFRALVYFALGKYGEASGILNPVLASGPGWGWDTMIGFYDSAGTYEAQLRKLEAYVTSSPNKAEGHFLLGYHYMVCGYVEKAYAQFEQTVKLQPADGTAKQLRDLTKNSIPDSGTPSDAPKPPAPPPIPNEKLVGTWVSDRGKDGKITFTMKDNGEYVWNYSGTATPAELKGTYGLNDKGLLVLSSEDTQMVSEVKLDGDTKMQFSIVGAPDGDPGLSFTKS